jgi:hypothetical protein
MHNLLLTRFLVAADCFTRKSPGFRLSEVRICYELGSSSVSVESGQEGERESVSVIPDGWIKFQRLKAGAHEYFFPVLVEIDRSSAIPGKGLTH